MSSPGERWHEAGTTHQRVLLGIEDRSERMRMLASAPLFSLWSDCKRELEEAAAEMDRLRKRIAELEASHGRSA
jgi:hypothetical protein